MKDEYFEIIRQFKLWILEKLGDYGNNESLEEKLDRIKEREKDGLALARTMLDDSLESELDK